MTDNQNADYIVVKYIIVMYFNNRFVCYFWNNPALQV